MLECDVPSKRQRDDRYTLIKQLPSGERIRLYTDCDVNMTYLVLDDIVLILRHRQLIYLRKNLEVWRYEVPSSIDTPTLTSSGEVIVNLGLESAPCCPADSWRYIILSPMGQLIYQRDVKIDFSLEFITNSFGHIYELGIIQGSSKYVKCGGYSYDAWTLCMFDKTNTALQYFDKTHCKGFKNEYKIDTGYEMLENYAALHVIIASQPQLSIDQLNHFFGEMLIESDISFINYTDAVTSVYHDSITITNCEDIAYALCKQHGVTVLCQSTVEDQLLVVAVFAANEEGNVLRYAWEVDGNEGRVDDNNELDIIKMIGLPVYTLHLKEVFKMTDFSMIAKQFNEKLDMPFYKRDE